MNRVAMIMICLLALLVPCEAPNVNPKIKKLVDSLSSVADKEKIVVAVDEVISLLVQDGLAHTDQRLHPKSVGVHPSNRYGFGVHSSRVHRLGAAIIGMGFSLAATSLAICIRDGPARKSAKFTEVLQNGSKSFGKSSPGQVRYGSLACGHTNQFLVACLDGVESKEESLTIDGRISKDKITKGNPQLPSALAEGLSWTVIEPEAEDMYPALAGFIQKARQKVGLVQNDETHLQKMLAIHEMHAQDMPFHTIKELMREENPNVDEHTIHVLIEHVKKFSGGKNSCQFLHDLRQFDSLCVPANRELNIETLEAYQTVKLESHELSPYMVNASIMCDLDCPANKVKQGVVNFVKSSSIRAWAKDKKALMIESNQHMKTFKQWVEALNLTLNEAVEYKGRAMCQGARAAHDLPVSQEYADMTIPEMYKIMCDAIITKHSLVVENPFAEDLSAPKAEAPCAPLEKFDQVIEYDLAGNPKNANVMSLREQGYYEGVDVEDITADSDGQLEHSSLLLCINVDIRGIVDISWM